MSYSEGVSIRPRFTTIYFDDIHSKTLEGVEEEKRECQEEVYKIRERLAMLIPSTMKCIHVESKRDHMLYMT